MGHGYLEISKVGHDLKKVEDHCSVLIFLHVYNSNQRLKWLRIESQGANYFNESTQKQLMESHESQ